jgi:hypothetical protein
MAGQTEMGKAFEYACLKALFESLKTTQEVVIEETPAVHVAKKFYDETPVDEAGRMDFAAFAAVRVIARIEPQLEYPRENIPLFLNIQEDARGIAGDVRDVLCMRRQNNWEIGFSCKHNHFAVKHSRLSNTIDFGEQWFGKHCSPQYFNEIEPLFAELTLLKAQGILWRELENKEARFYIPLLNAFVSELSRLDTLYPIEIPPSLITYLLGRNDFYKVIAKDSNRTTEIQAYNIFGSLNKPAGERRPLSKIPQVKLPNRIFDISFKPNSSNTIIVTCDQGWAVSLRIHNASSKVEPSLKFDVNLVGTPNLGSMIEPWE